MGTIMSFNFKKKTKRSKNFVTSKEQITNLNLFNKLICHRIPERTFNIRGHYFPVCSRCTGFYMAAFSYFVYVYFFYVQYTPILIIAAIFMLIPTCLDGFTQLWGFRESSNALRLFTGLMGGVGLGILIKAFKFFILG
jgi:uncharacterized membrane protein